MAAAAAQCIFWSSYSHSPFPLGAGNDVAETLSPPFVFNLTIELRGNDIMKFALQFLTKTRVQFVVDWIQ